MSVIVDAETSTNTTQKYINVQPRRTDALSARCTRRCYARARGNARGADTPFTSAAGRRAKLPLYARSSHTA